MNREGLDNTTLGWRHLSKTGEMVNIPAGNQGIRKNKQINKQTNKQTNKMMKYAEISGNLKKRSMF